MAKTGVRIKRKLEKLKFPKRKRRRAKKAKPYSVEDGITQSMLSSFVDCRVRSRFSLQGWEVPVQKDALVFGSLFHWLLERGYGAIAQGNPSPPEGEELLAEWVGGNLGGLLDPQSAEEHAAMAWALYDPYWEVWTEDLGREWIGVESQFDVDWNGFRLRGMRDGVFRDRKGRINLLETKTRSRLGTDLSDALAFDFQSLFYVLALEHETGERVNRVLYNVVRKPGIKRRAGEALPEFAGRMREDIENRAETYYHRFEVYFTQKQKALFVRELEQKLRDFTEWVEAGMPDTATYRNEAACIKRWTCEFLPACASGTMAGFTQTKTQFEELL